MKYKHCKKLRFVSLF